MGSRHSCERNVRPSKSKTSRRMNTSSCMSSTMAATPSPSNPSLEALRMLQPQLSTESHSQALPGPGAAAAGHQLSSPPSSEAPLELGSVRVQYVYATWSFDLEELGLRGLPPPPTLPPAQATPGGAKHIPRAPSDQGPSLQAPTSNGYTSSGFAGDGDSCGSCWSCDEDQGSSRTAKASPVHSLEPAADGSTAAGQAEGSARHWQGARGSGERQLFCSPVFEVEAAVAPALVAYQLLPPGTSSTSTKWRFLLLLSGGVARLWLQLVGGAGQHQGVAWSGGATLLVDGHTQVALTGVGGIVGQHSSRWRIPGSVDLRGYGLFPTHPATLDSAPSPSSSSSSSPSTSSRGSKKHPGKVALDTLSLSDNFQAQLQLAPLRVTCTTSAAAVAAGNGGDGSNSLESAPASAHPPKAGRHTRQHPAGAEHGTITPHDPQHSTAATSCTTTATTSSRRRPAAASSITQLSGPAAAAACLEPAASARSFGAAGGLFVASIAFDEVMLVPVAAVPRFGSVGDAASRDGGSSGGPEAGGSGYGSSTSTSTSSQQPQAHPSSKDSVEDGTTGNSRNTKATASGMGAVAAIAHQQQNAHAIHSHGVSSATRAPALTQVSPTVSPVSLQSPGPQLQDLEVWELSSNPRLVVVDGLLPAAACRDLIQLASPHMIRSRVATGSETPSRTSWSHFFTREAATHPLVLEVEGAIGALFGDPLVLGPRPPLAKTEALQVIHYHPGEFYHEHYDNRAGAPLTRNATIIIYLCDTEDGGGTHFPRALPDGPALTGALVAAGDKRGDTRRVCASPAGSDPPPTISTSSAAAASLRLPAGVTVNESGQGIHVLPRTGRAVLFWSAQPNGVEDPASLHAAETVAAGEKWIATRWMKLQG